MIKQHIVRIVKCVDIFSLLSGLVGGTVFFLLYKQTIPVTHIAWIINDGWDTFQHQIGWEFFRNSPWTFPIGVSTSYGYPVGLPIAYTDSIPLLAIPFKLFRSLLPDTFQYLGMWMLVCVILQGVFGYFFEQDNSPKTHYVFSCKYFFHLEPNNVF